MTSLDVTQPVRYMRNFVSTSTDPKHAQGAGGGEEGEERGEVRKEEMERPCSNSAFNPADPELPVRQALQVRVMSGHYLPKPHESEKGEIIDPYVHSRHSGKKKEKRRKGGEVAL